MFGATGSFFAPAQGQSRGQPKVSALEGQIKRRLAERFLARLARARLPARRREVTRCAARPRWTTRLAGRSPSPRDSTVGRSPGTSTLTEHSSSGNDMGENDPSGRAEPMESFPSRLLNGLSHCCKLAFEHCFQLLRRGKRFAHCVGPRRAGLSLAPSLSALRPTLRGTRPCRRPRSGSAGPGPGP